ncbi:MAG: DMT family transporter, partial [Candidatus Diapherotrites archaeon]
LNLALGTGVALIIGSQVSWALYSVLIKRQIRKQTRLQILCFIFPLAFLFTLPFASFDLAFSQPQIIPFFAIFPVAGGIAMGLANLFQFKAIETKGLMITNSSSLVYPFLTAVMGFLVFGETLTMAQLAFACILVLGAYLIIRCKCDVRQIE